MENRGRYVLQLSTVLSGARRQGSAADALFVKRASSTNVSGGTAATFEMICAHAQFVESTVVLRLLHAAVQHSALRCIVSFC